MSTTAPSKRDVSSVAPRAYESLLDNEQNLLQLLQAVRGSAMDESSKLSLRDMILEYSGSNDETTKTDLKSKISTLLSENSRDFMSLVSRRLKPTEGEREIKPIEKQTTPASSPTSLSVGRVRPKPNFGSSAPTKSEPTPQPEPAKPEEKPEPAPEAPATPAPTPEVKPVAELVAEAPATPAPSAPTPEPVASTPAPKTNADMQTRINEIKHAVNGHVGNPINLMSANREVGQEYMASLLDAMKKASSGLASESDAAMARLETAYKAVDKLIQENPDLGKNKPASAPTPPPPKSTPALSTGAQRPAVPPTPKPVPAPKAPLIPREPAPVEKLEATPQPAPTPTPKPVESIAPEPKPQENKGLYHQPEDNLLYKDLPEDVAVELTKKPLTQAEEAKPVSEAPKANPAPEPEVKPKKSLIKSLADGLLFGKSDKKPTPPETPKTEEKPVEVKPATPITPTPPKEVEVPKAEPKPPTPAPELKPAPKVPEKPAESDKLKSVATTTKLPEKITALKESLAKKEEESKKPITGLDAPEVTAGLEQLLSEWKLFRSSGWLGTGPGGVSHPLYKQISSLPMAAVVSGRFEGVTPEIKQSITDYMNGWRYEQGIVHQMGETFENYLRRVILQILDKQRTMKKVKEEAKAEAESEK